MNDFQHVKLAEVAPGVYEGAYTPTVDGHHMAYISFKRDREDLYFVVGHNGKLNANLSVDLTPKIVNGLRVEFIPPAEIRAKESALFRIRVEDASNGEGVRDLEPYLGAGANIAIVSADGHHIMQMYAQPGVPRQSGMREMPAPTLPFGPNLGFTQTFEEPGLYKVWVQVQRDGQVITAPFTIEVK